MGIKPDGQVLDKQSEGQRQAKDIKQRHKSIPAAAAWNGI